MDMTGCEARAKRDGKEKGVKLKHKPCFYWLGMLTKFGKAIEKLLLRQL
jgi:hypothetical protein